MTERERKKRFNLAMKWAREEQVEYYRKRTDKSLGGMCIAAMAVWARAHDSESCEQMGDLFGEIAATIGEQVE